MAPPYPHLVLDCKDLDISDEFMNDKNYIVSFMNHLIKAINMRKLGRLQVQWLEEPEELRGFSAIQIIHTSSIVLHVFPFDGTMNLDVFSCKEFSVDVVVALVRQYFRPGTISYQVINRGFAD